MSDKTVNLTPPLPPSISCHKARNPRVALLAAFALTVLATMVNVACSNVLDVDTGTSESGLSGYGPGYGYGHGAAHDVADDVAR